MARFSAYIPNLFGTGSKKYIAFKDSPLPVTGPGSNGVSEEQLKHFKVLADLAQKYNLKLIVGLVWSRVDERRARVSPAGTGGKENTY